MRLFDVFACSTISGLSLCLCLGTTLWCIHLLRRRSAGADRLLLGLIGLVCVYQGLDVLEQAGLLIAGPERWMGDLATLVVHTLFVGAVVLVDRCAADHRVVRKQLRVAQASSQQAATSWGTLSAAHLLDSLPTAAFAVDQYGHVQCWNAAAESLLGWRRSELVGQALPLTDDAGPRLRHKDGGTTELRGWTAPLRGAGDVPVGTAVVLATASACAVDAEAIAPCGPLATIGTADPAEYRGGLPARLPLSAAPRLRPHHALPFQAMMSAPLRKEA